MHGSAAPRDGGGIEPHQTPCTSALTVHILSLKKIHVIHYIENNGPLTAIITTLVKSGAFPQAELYRVLRMRYQAETIFRSCKKDWSYKKKTRAKTSVNLPGSSKLTSIISVIDPYRFCLSPAAAKLTMHYGWFRKSITGPVNAYFGFRVFRSLSAGFPQASVRAHQQLRIHLACDAISTTYRSKFLYRPRGKGVKRCAHLAV